MKIIPLLLLGLIALPALGAESAYRIVHPDGTVEFSDQPQEGAESVLLPEAQTVHTPKPTLKPSPPAPKPKPKTHVYSAFAIASPGEDAVLRNIQEKLAVSLTVEPGLGEKHQIVLSFDGREVAQGTALQYTVEDVYRGSHTLSAVIRDENGQVVMSAPAVTFHVKQTSSLRKKGL